MPTRLIRARFPQLSRARARWGAVLVGLTVTMGVLVAPAPAQADPYWRVQVYVTPGKSSCSLRWVRSYWDGPVNAYKVWVVPQEVGPNAPQTYRQVSVTPPSAGGTANVRIGSLTKGAGYVFWLQAFYPSYFRNGPINMQVATSRVCIPT
ncbi:hypothetical protein [Cryptosporangium sp. NPDC048952]|uniref:hypothetical protein n=1 Tax=Cryptosporangium sp. NPDC048952 TaxID=3363961 RepID=UPI00371EEC3A